MMQTRSFLSYLSVAALRASNVSLCAPILFQASRFFTSKRPPESEKDVVSRLTGKKTKPWELYNEIIYPPRDTSSVIDGTNVRRPAEITYSKRNILYSRKKLWLLAFMIRGISVDEAFQQLGFRPEKGARILEQALEAAVERAVADHDVEFCTELWIEHTQVLRGMGVQRIHKGLRTNVSYSNYHYANLYLRLREGRPPAIYHPYRIRPSWVPVHNCPADGLPGWSSARDVLELELRRLRRRRIPGEL